MGKNTFSIIATYTSLKVAVRFQDEKQTELCRVCGSHSNDYEEISLLGYATV
jgi:hypothetical protein